MRAGQLGVDASHMAGDIFLFDHDSILYTLKPEMSAFFTSLQSLFNFKVGRDRALESELL
jgi:hypothetical protein